jgi:hypothetical protein
VTNFSERVIFVFIILVFMALFHEKGQAPRPDIPWSRRHPDRFILQRQKKRIVRLCLLAD